MNLTMVGTGYVGLVTGACFASTGNTVVCLDIDEAKIQRLKSGQCPIYEPGLGELITRNAAAGRLQFTTSKADAYRRADAIFICVGTPSADDGTPDVNQVMQVAADIAEVLESLPNSAPGSPPKLIVVKSTVPVGTTDKVRDLIRARTRRPFLIANNPEFLKEGAAVNDFLKPDRVVCGIEDEAAGRLMRDLYEPFVRQGNPIFVMDVRSSEMVKYASNAMLACKISFINEMANLCQRLGADVQAVREGMCADHRIGKQFLYPGLGYGGSCFPKDTLAVVRMGESAGLDCKLNQAVHEVNQDQRRHFWERIERHFGGHLRGRSLAFWGIAFKPQTDDIREAPSLTLMTLALQTGATVRAFDPVAGVNLRQAMPQVTVCEEMYDTLTGADALIICTEWTEFRQPDFARIGSLLKSKVIFDGRNIYRPDQLRRLGFTYESIGRAPVNPSPAPGTGGGAGGAAGAGGAGAVAETKPRPGVMTSATRPAETRTTRSRKP